ncbi:Alkali-sensitive linkage protein 1 [Colletotrichum sp. SAR11_240]|nr:Alkali-sensitive linkage protein 1 [Colletotrichum sp. SAR11_240]
MYTKKALSLAATLALAEQAMGFNAHRHAHQDKRAMQYDIVTYWVTVTETEGNAPSTPTPTPAAQQPVAEVSSSPLPSTTTSTSIVVVPTPYPVAPAPTTTLITSYAPKVQQAAPASSSSSAAVFQAAAVNVAATSATSSKAAAASTVSTGGKRGLAYNSASLVSNFFSSGNSCEQCSWAYNWDSSSNGLSESLNYVPMLWGPIDTHTARWTANADAAIKAGSTHILSFNEPDLPAQANLDAATAATAHVKYMNPYSGKVKIGSPAITNSNIAGQGLDWLKAWVSACDTAGCAYDFCVTHWYSPSDAADTLFSHLQSVHEICGNKPVWLTEFAPLGSDDQISSFVQTNVPKLDAVSYLDRYSYFMVSDGVLTSGTGLSALGKTYASAA